MSKINDVGSRTPPQPAAAEAAKPGKPAETFEKVSSRSAPTPMGVEKTNKYAKATPSDPLAAAFTASKSTSRGESRPASERVADLYADQPGAKEHPETVAALVNLRQRLLKDNVG